MRQKDAESSEVLNRVFTEIETTYKPTQMSLDDKRISENKDDKKNKKYLAQSLTKYGRKEQKLISRIYEIIIAMLPKDMADMVVTKIQEELNK